MGQTSVQLGVGLIGGGIRRAAGLACLRAGLQGSWPRTAFCWLVSLRQFLLWSALFAALALYLENWFPILTPYTELVETYYFSWFPLLTWT